MSLPRHKSVLFSLGGVLAAGVLVVGASVAWSQAPKPTYPDASARRVTLKTRGEGDLAKLSPELQVLHNQFASTRPQGRTYSDEQLQYLFGITSAEKQPSLQVAVTLKPGASLAAGSGFAVRHQQGTLAYVTVAARALGQLAAQDAVVKVVGVPAAQVPQMPARPKMESGPATRVRGETTFDKQGLSGQGVLVGIIDTGIDWRHEDFRRADGTTRILYLWDMMDGSFDDSEGSIGAEAPVGVEFLGIPGMLVGTLYDADAINSALNGDGTCNSVDVHGHGTACASIAAGNGRATAGDVEAGTWAGLAPDADLIICRAGDGSFDNNYIYAAEWMIRTAQELGRPIVINMSLGGHFSSHDGNAPTEVYLNGLVGDVPGAVICVSAGNEGRASFHAGGRFGPRLEGQMDVDSAPIELNVSQDTELHAYFSMQDDWGLGLTGLDRYLVDASGNAGSVFVARENGTIQFYLSNSLDVAAFQPFIDSIRYEDLGNDQQHVVIPVPAGKYQTWGYGATASVSQGTYDLYLPITFQGSFGGGTVKSGMVGTPGNASNVITVGAYDFRKWWLNRTGSMTNYNLEMGGIADFSSPGYRRDGVVKPDIAAPGRFAVSAMAVDSEMAAGAGDTHVTSDGYHLAWEGTSASSPYAVGVVALLLEKNPQFTARQVKEILSKSATADRQTGAVPNGTWGYGKINPEAAIRATSR